MHERGRMSDYNGRQGRYGEEHERYPAESRYPIADRAREERERTYKHIREYQPRYDDRYDGRGYDDRPDDRRYDGRAENLRVDDFDRMKRDLREEFGFRERVPVRGYDQGPSKLKDRYEDYPPPGVDEYDEYNGTAPSRDRHRRGRESRDRESDFDRIGRELRELRDRSPIRSTDESRDKHHSSDRFEERLSALGHGTDEENDRCGEKWIMDEPTNTVILRGLPPECDEKDILKELSQWSVTAKDVRLMRKKASGISRGFAFIEFKNVDEARHWMDTTQGRLTIRGQAVSLYYSCPKATLDRVPDTDWTCNKCHAHNFKRRDQCYICGITRGESDRAKEGDGFDHIGSNPCNTLIFRGLDALTTERTLRKAIRTVTKVKSKNCKVMTDTLTGTSLGYAFAEFASVKQTKEILEILQDSENPFEVDGKLLLVAYAKNTYSTIMATFDNNTYPPHSQAQQSQQWNQQQQQYDYSTGQYYDTYNQGQYYQGQQGPPLKPYEVKQMNQYYQQNPQQAVAQHKASARANNSASIAQAAIQQAQAAKTSHIAAVSTATSTAANTIYPTPDVSTYQYDQTSGYYYDASTGLYYDANTQYYYNNQTNKFLYWCAEKSTYLPAPTGDATDPKIGADTTVDPNETKKDKEKREKSKAAKKIAKDMEKWAKSQNISKNPFAQPAAPAPAVSAPAKSDYFTSSKSADAGFSLFEKSKTDMSLMPPPPMPMSSAPKKDLSPGLVASYGGDSDGDDDEESIQATEESLLDWDKMICQLCKRQFNSPDMLQKHKDLSDLHKQNMAKLSATKSSKRSEKNYRDRAAERRQKYGAPKPPDVKKEMQFPTPVDMRQPGGPATQSAVANKMMQKMGWAEGQGLGKSAQGRVNPVEDVMIQITEDGKSQSSGANKMMQKMGWAEGQGLGKSAQGRVNPVEAKMRSATAGLGSRGSSYDVPAVGVDYREAGKLSMFSRYADDE